MTTDTDFDTLSEIARRVGYVPTLVSRNIDALDFHDIGVATLRAMLEDAFEAGRESVR